MSWLGWKVTGYTPCLSRDWLLTCTGTLCSPKRPYTVKATIFFLFSPGLVQCMFAWLKLSSFTWLFRVSVRVCFLESSKILTEPIFPDSTRTRQGRRGRGHWKRTLWCGDTCGGTPSWWRVCHHPTTVQAQQLAARHVLGPSGFNGELVNTRFVMGGDYKSLLMRSSVSIC